VVDWRVAERIAVAVAGGEDAPGDATPSILRPQGFEAVCAAALELAGSYARLEPLAPIPPPELVGRAEWSRGVLATLGELTAELERSGSFEVSLPGPLGRIARSLLGIGAGTEVGLAAGYAARRVLGQYDIDLLGVERPPRLLFVVPNLTATAAELEIEIDDFVRWVALHENTHALQFAAAPWLRDHLGELIRGLLSGAGAQVSLGGLARRVARDPRGAVSSFLRGDIAKAMVGEAQAPTLDRIQATMTVVEGHAEHVMDGAGGDFVPSVEALRAKLDRRRSRRGPLETIIARMLGLDLKLRQYRQGKAFCDEVVREAGIDGLNRVWTGPDALPSAAELERPQAWLERHRVAVAR
jgi:coenzyme F420 biosynthesis associated uncharacterized protein